MSEIQEVMAIMASNKKKRQQVDNDIGCGVEDNGNRDDAAPPAKVRGQVVITTHHSF